MGRWLSHEEFEIFAASHNLSVTAHENGDCLFTALARTPNNVLLQCKSSLGYYSSSQHPASSSASLARILGSPCHAYLALRMDTTGVHVSGITHDASCLCSRALERGVRVKEARLSPTIAQEAEISLRAGMTGSQVVRTNLDYLRKNGLDAYAKVNGVEQRLALNKDDIKVIRRRLAAAGSQRPREDAFSSLNHMLSTAVANPATQDLRDAVIFYKARAAEHPDGALVERDRMELVIMTPAMRALSRELGHGGMIFMDGTFGISTAKLLFFAVLARDRHGHGVPIAYIIFTARSAAKQASASYDADVLRRLLQRWKDGVISDSFPQFAPKVAMTDNDARERLALSLVFPGIYLLLCRFHLRQSWTNHRKGSIKSAKMLSALRSLELALITDGSDGARARLAQSVAAMKAAVGPDAAVAGHIARHLNYIEKEWLNERLADSWTATGIQHAATLLSIDPADVPRTNNVSEGFAGLLKNFELAPILRNGHRPRIDVLIAEIVRNTTPILLFRRTLQAQVKDRKQSARIIALQVSGATAGSMPRWVANADRDKRAADIIAAGYLGELATVDGGQTTTVLCRSETDANVTYLVVVAPPAAMTCSCLDQQARGRGCKHLRAACRKFGISPPGTIPSPRTLEQRYAWL